MTWPDDDTVETRDRSSAIPSPSINRRCVNRRRVIRGGALLSPAGPLPVAVGEHPGGDLVEHVLALGLVVELVVRPVPDAHRGVG